MWLTQEVLAKQKRVGGISTRYYGARTNGPPSSVSEEKVRIFVSVSLAIRTIQIQQVARCCRQAKELVLSKDAAQLGRAAFPAVLSGCTPGRHAV